VTLHEALKAAETLAGEGKAIRVVDLFSVKPVDKDGLLAAAQATGNKILTVEDHYLAGGIMEAVCSVLATENVQVFGIYVDAIPHSGKPDEMLEAYGISASKIVTKVHEILGQ
jgi:transketolase